MIRSRLIIPEQFRPKRRAFRIVSAVWHDSRALFNEFRRPLLTMLLSIVFGGFVYGELHNFAGIEPSIALIDRPYTMIQLMIIETPVEYVSTPDEWYLILFWYLQPAIGIYIIGQGAVDFVRLFFNRTERRSAWELAVAQTYRNHVILIGVGHIGLRIARTLHEMGFEIVAIDSSHDSEADEGLEQMNIPLVVEDARSVSALSDAGLEHAQSIIICTSNDHVNLEITMRVRDLNPNIRIVTRMWDARLSAQLKRFLDVEVLSASDIAAPAFAGSALGIEITQTLKIAGQDYSVIRLTVQSGSFMEGQAIAALQEHEDADIMLHSAVGKEPIVHPDGDTIVSAGDTLVLFAKHGKIIDIVSRNQAR